MLKKIFKNSTKENKKSLEKKFDILSGKEVKTVVGGNSETQDSEIGLSDDELEARAKGFHDKIKGYANT